MASKRFWTKAGKAAVGAAWALAGILLKAAKLAVKLLWKSLVIVVAMFLRLLGAMGGSVARASAPRAAGKPFRQLKSFHGSAGDFESWLHSDRSTVGIILGSRGSGKTGLGLRLLENFAASGRKVYAMGFPEGRLPRFINSIGSVESAGNGGVILVDEGGLAFNSRDSMSKSSKLLSQLLFISRHKDLSIIFISQNSANLEVNAIRQADYLLLKKPSLLQSDFERGKTGKIYAQAAGDFKELGADPGLTYVYSDVFRGFVSNFLPSFWSESASKAFAGRAVG